METSTTNAPALLKEQVLPEVLATAPEILLKNQVSTTNAHKAFVAITDKIEKDGMSDLYDKELSGFVDKASATLKLMDERRKPVTQMIDLIKKQFTGLENELKTDKTNAQKLRDDYATKKMEQIRADEAKKAQELAKTTEAANLKSVLYLYYDSKFIDIIADEKQKWIDWFNGLSFDETNTTQELLFASASERLKNWKDYSATQADILNAWKITLPTANYHTVEEVKQFASNKKMEMLSKLEKQYNIELKLFIQDCQDKLPSKIMEVYELSLADAEEAQRILNDQKKREADEAAALKADTEAKKTESAGNAAIQATGEIAAAMVDSTAAVDNTPKVAESYNIKVLNRAAWALIFQFWFEHEGKSLTDEKLEKYTLLRMKNFCEKWAKDNDEKIQSPVLSYEAVYKAK